MATIEVRVRPGARSDSVTVDESGRIAATVTAAPDRGRANAHLLKLLAKRLGVAKSLLQIVRGARARDKVVDVAGMTGAQVAARLRARGGRR